MVGFLSCTLATTISRQLSKYSNGIFHREHSAITPVMGTITMTIKSFKRTLLGVAIATVSCHASAAGFQLNAQSATGLGRAFAGDAVIADNASVMARNAAAMTLFDKTAMSVGFETVTTMIEVKDAVYSPGSVSANYDDAGSTSIAPNFYFITPIDDRLSIGISAYTNFGTKTEFSDDYTGYEYGGTTDLKTFNLGLATGFRLDENWSIGGGLDFIYGQGKLHRETSTSVTVLDVDAKGWAVGFNAGVLYEVDDNNRYGLDYHYSPEVKADGKINYVYSGSGEIDDTLNLTLPDFAEFSGYNRVTNQVAIHYSIQWIKWSEFDSLTADKSGNLKDYKWKDAWHYSLGATYYLNPTWTLRVGYMYDTSAQDQDKSISVPDSDRQWLSTGFGYKLDEKSNIDLGFTYLLGKDVKVTEGSSSSITGTTHADAIMFGLQYSRTF